MKSRLHEPLTEMHTKMAAARIRLSPIGVVLLGLCSVALVLYFTTDGGLGYYFDSGTSTVSMQQLLSAAIDLAEKGGEEARKVRESADLHEESKGQTREGANDPRTLGDMLSHKAMYYGFQKAFSKVNVVSEEHDHGGIKLEEIASPSLSNEEVSNVLSKSGKKDEQVSTGDVLVWIDPLDATQEYTENLLQYVTTMVCIAVNGKPVVGVIHKPFLRKTAWAWVGHGHSESLTVPDSKLASNSSPRVIVSRSHSGTVKEAAVEAFGEEASVTPAGGAGYKVLSLFQDKPQDKLDAADAYIHVTLIKKWDICAGDAILRALGGKMTTLDGEEIDYSDGEKPKNEKGLLAALHNYESFRQKLIPIAKRKAEEAKAKSS